MEHELKDIAKRLKRLDRADISNWLKRGELLLLARDTVGTQDGFRAWLRQQGIPKTTAYKCMAAFRNFDGVPTSGRFSKEAMHILEKSEDARTDAIALSKKSKITARIAKQLVNKYIPNATAEAKAPIGFTRVFLIGDISITVKSKDDLSQGDLIGALAAAVKETKGGGLFRAA